MTPAARARVREMWSAEGIALDDAALAAYVAERRARLGADAALAELDLALACACEAGDAGAIRVFEARYFPSVRRALGRAGIPDAVGEEVVTSLRARLFAAVDGERPLLAGYSGRGDLGAWTRTVALRAALTQLRRERRHVDLDRAPDVPFADPELVYLREHYAAQLGDVLTAAFAALSLEQRAILRQYYRHGLTIDDLGRILGIHRVTAARRIKAARDALVAEVRARIRQVLDIDDPTAESIFRLLGSRLAVENLLRTTTVGVTQT